MRTTIVLALLLLTHSAAATATSLVEVPPAQLSQWWVWTNAPAVNYQAHGYFVDRKIDNFEVELAFTISNDGAVSDCAVVHKSDPEQPDDKLCDLISLHEYAPAKSNPQRVPVRTRFQMTLGVSAARVQELMRDNPKN